MKTERSTKNDAIIKKAAWKMVAAFTVMPILLNLGFLCIVLTHFNTFNGAPAAEKIANILMYVANWPNFLFHMYPYVKAVGGETVYEALGWVQPFTFTVNLIGWGVMGFLTSYLVRNRR